jgi:hypothetical protein
MSHDQLVAMAQRVTQVTQEYLELRQKKSDMEAKLAAQSARMSELVRKHEEMGSQLQTYKKPASESFAPLIGEQSGGRMPILINHAYLLLFANNKHVFHS